MRLGVFCIFAPKLQNGFGQSCQRGSWLVGGVLSMTGDLAFTAARCPTAHFSWTTSPAVLTSATTYPAPIPSAVDPHTVERAWFRASRWSAPLYERPGRPEPRLLGSAWVDGGRDGSTPRTPLPARGRRRCPLYPGAGRSPAGGIACDRRSFCAVLASWPSALPISGRASAQRGRSGPKAGAAPGAEPGSAPGGAERSRGLMR